MFHIERLTTSEQLTAVRDDWDRLSDDLPFRAYDWHANWWKHFQTDGAQLYVLAARDEQDDVVGIAPWFAQQHSTQGHVLACLGSGDVCSDYQTILADARCADAVAAACADWLTAAAGDPEHHWDTLLLEAVPACDTTMNSFVGHLWSGGSKIHREAGPNCWRIELPPTWEEYVATLSKSHRKQVRRIERRQLDSGRAVLHTTAGEAGLQRGMEILVDLHQRRRQSLGEPGCFSSDAFAGFLHDTAGHFHQAGKLSLAWIEIDGTPAAAEFQLTGGHATYAYQAGLNPDLLEEEPGRIINIATIRQAIEQGHQGFDFLRGDEPYKAHWRATPRETINYRVASPAALAQVRHGLWLAGDSMKSWVKTGLELTGMR
mgnify:CR=1 FL=1